MTEGQQGRGAVGEDKTLSRRKASQGASKRRLHAWRAGGGRGYPESPSLLRRVTVGERKPRLQSNGIVSIYYRVAWQQKKWSLHLSFPRLFLHLVVPRFPPHAPLS